MAHASPAKRRMRRLKRENTLAYRMIELATRERDVARAVANQLAQMYREQAKAGIVDGEQVPPPLVVDDTPYDPSDSFVKEATPEPEDNVQGT